MSTIRTLLALALTAACLSAQGPPSITSGGVVSASSFGQFKSIAPGSWIEIFGSNLSTNSRSWTGTDFSGVNAPTSLDKTKVTVGGQDAFISFISPGQVNAQVPSNIGTGPQSIVATTPAGSSAPYTITVNSVQPGLLAPSSFSIAGKQNVVALFSDGTTFVLPPATISGVASRRAQPGDVITLYGIGFGPVTPSIPAGQIVQQSNTLALPFQILFGPTPAAFLYDGLAPSAVGLYQFNVTVPNVTSSDAVPVTFTVGGVAQTQTLYIAVQSSSLPKVQGLSFSSNSVASGGTVQGTVVLSAPAPAGGTVVALVSNQSAATVPATVTVPAGATSATFTISTGTVSSNQTATITASYSGSSAQASLTVTPAALKQPSSITIFANPGSGVGNAGMGVSGPAGDGSYNSGGASGDLGTIHYLATWNKVTVSGQTLTFSGLSTDISSSYVKNGPTLAPIASGSLTVTLMPDISGASGTVTGSLTLVSTAGTVSGSFTGFYVGAF
jgi:uncharacterized protein (TIGR03437 family)